jgi:hypothetical protein
MGYLQRCAGNEYPSLEKTVLTSIPLACLAGNRIDETGIVKECFKKGIPHNRMVHRARGKRYCRERMNKTYIILNLLKGEV